MTTICFNSRVLKPLDWIFSPYVAASTLGNVNAPSVLDTARSRAPVAWFVSAQPASGTGAPEGSTTMPLTELEMFCPNAENRLAPAKIPAIT
ncbi:MAG: hypothetical protein IT165_14665 [Bryobacterales bacterium]|nr:hypothetical protein [Bryobacterales bacterium]